MREIHISLTTFEHLTALANPGEEPGDVIARLLAQATGTRNEPTTRPVFQMRPRRIGTLKPLIDSGDFIPGDELHITWSRLGRDLTVTIDEHGKLRTVDGRVYSSPSAAGFSATGHTGSASARFWIHVRSGRTLAWWKEHIETRDDLRPEPSTSDRADDYLTDPFGNQDRSEPQ